MALNMPPPTKSNKITEKRTYNIKKHCVNFLHPADDMVDALAEAGTPSSGSESDSDVSDSSSSADDGPAESAMPASERTKGEGESRSPKRRKLEEDSDDKLALAAAPKETTAESLDSESDDDLPGSQSGCGDGDRDEAAAEKPDDHVEAEESERMPDSMDKAKTERAETTAPHVERDRFVFNQGVETRTQENIRKAVQAAATKFAACRDWHTESADINSWYRCF